MPQRRALALVLVAMALALALAVPLATVVAEGWRREAPVPSAAAPKLALLLPFPLTGPRDIHGVERATRSQRAVAAQAPRPISDLLAHIVVSAAAGSGSQVVTVRRSSADNRFGIVRAADAREARPAVRLLNHEAMAYVPVSAREGEAVESEALIAPLALMPLVLVASPHTAIPGPGRAGWTAIGRPLRMGSAGATTVSSFAAEDFVRMLRAEWLVVPYNGGQAALNALAANEVHFQFAALPLALPYLDRGGFMPVGLASLRRFALLPQLPTLAEQGFPGFVWEGWFALYEAGPLTPQLRTTLQARLRDALASSAVRSALLQHGLELPDADPARFSARVEADRRRVRELLRPLA